MIAVNVGRSLMIADGMLPSEYSRSTSMRSRKGSGVETMIRSSTYSMVGIAFFNATDDSVLNSDRGMSWRLTVVMAWTARSMTWSR